MAGHQGALPAGPAQAHIGRGAYRARGRRPRGVRAGRRVQRRREQASQEIADMIGRLAAVPRRLYGGGRGYNNYNMGQNQAGEAGYQDHQN